VAARQCASNQAGCPIGRRVTWLIGGLQSIDANQRRHESGRGPAQGECDEAVLAATHDHERPDLRSGQRARYR
jgi:hypothetical protein